MLYRPLGHSGMALSTVGLRLSHARLSKNLPLLRKLIVTGLENGINAYHFDTCDTAFLTCAAEAFACVDRKLLFVSVNAHEPGQATDADTYALTPLKERLRGVIKLTGLQWIDLLYFQTPGSLSLPPDSRHFLDALKASKFLRYLGAIGDVRTIHELIRTGLYKIIQTDFDIDSSWDKRRSLDDAVNRDMSVIATDFFPAIYAKASDVVPQDARRGFFGGKAKNPLAGAGTHAFLHQTADWTPEELCLGYALSQANMACVLIDADTPEHLEALAAVPERHLPPSVPAQIEMARFNEQVKAG
ncbi:MAG: aldo/keto reductase [Asticcacaulis sp.]